MAPTGTTSSVYEDDETISEYEDDETSSVYEDDEPPMPVPVEPSRSGVLDYDVYTEYPAVPNGAAHDGFAVLVHLKAPALVTAPPLDLVAVLDVSDGNKLSHVKRAMAFVIDRVLGPRDRLSVVVAVSGDRWQATPLTRMTNDGKAAAKLAVDALEVAAAAASSRTRTKKVNVGAGLDEAAKVLCDRRFSWDDVVPTASVILASDGGGGHGSSRAAVPDSFLPVGGWTKTPVHTFGLGGSSSSSGPLLDAAALHGIAEATGGTFSFVADGHAAAAVQDAVAQCVAGLATVTARDVFLELSFGICHGAADTDADSDDDSDSSLEVTAVKSGRYEAAIKCAGGDDQAVEVKVGELYADEERRVLVFLDVPRLDDARYNMTRLISVGWSYEDVASGQPVEKPNNGGYVDIGRPVEARPPGVARCVEVEREVLRAAAAEDMATARDAAERGDHAEAARILDARREAVRSSAPAMAGDAVCAAVAAELHELSRRVADEQEYGKTGRACILASMSSHSLQRGASSSLGFCSGVGSSSSLFATQVMRKMEKLSETMRKRQQEVSPHSLTLPENARSKAGVPLVVGSHRRLEARLASVVPRLSMLGKYRRILLKR